MSDGTSEKQVEDIAADWLKAVRQMRGGAAEEECVLSGGRQRRGNVDFYFVLNALSFTDWGKIWDAYQDIPRPRSRMTRTGQGHLFRQPVVGSARDRSDEAARSVSRTSSA